MVTCLLFRPLDDRGAACCCCVDGGLLLPHPHRCGQSRQQKADQKPSMLIVTILQLTAYNKNVEMMLAFWSETG